MSKVLEAQILVPFVLRLTFGEIQGCRKSDLADFEHLTVKQTLYTVSTYP